MIRTSRYWNTEGSEGLHGWNLAHLSHGLQPEPGNIQIALGDKYLLYLFILFEVVHLNDSLHRNTEVALYALPVASPKNQMRALQLTNTAHFQELF